MVNYLPSTATRAITVLAAEVGTTLTISAPDSVIQGVAFNISGILIRNDTGAPIPNALISILYNGTPVGSGNTGIDGDYLITGTIPVAGTFTLTANFAGMTVPGLALSPSSAYKGIGTIGEPSMLPILLVLGIAAYAVLKK